MKEKNSSLHWVLVALISFSFASIGSAQDDLYYNPATDAPPTTTVNPDNDGQSRRTATLPAVTTTTTMLIMKMKTMIMLTSILRVFAVSIVQYK
jgi:hypothetical protein